MTDAAEEYRDMAEKRQHKRFIKRCVIEFVVDGSKYTGISSDFSFNGLFIRTRYPLIPDTMLHVTVYLPDGRVSKLTVKVKRAAKTATGRVMGTPVKSLKGGMGVEIIGRDVNYLHFIRSLLG